MSRHHTAMCFFIFTKKQLVSTPLTYSKHSVRSDASAATTDTKYQRFSSPMMQNRVETNWFDCVPSKILVKIEFIPCGRMHTCLADIFKISSFLTKLSGYLWFNLQQKPGMTILWITFHDPDSTISEFCLAGIRILNKSLAHKKNNTDHDKPDTRSANWSIYVIK